MVTRIWHRIRVVVDVAAGLGIVVIAGILVCRAFVPGKTAVVAAKPAGAMPVPSEPISVANTYVKGKPNAPVFVLEYADFECPACKQFATSTFSALAARFIDTGRVKFGFRHFPLGIHPFARPAAIAAQCAGKQNKFWEFHQQLFEHPEKLGGAAIVAAAKSTGLDTAQWSSCQTGTGAREVGGHLADAKALDLKGTPVFFVGQSHGNDQVRVAATIYGSRPVEEFERAIAQVEAAIRSAPSDVR